MTGERWAVLVVAKGATVSECTICGAVVFHRAIHDAHHAVAEREATAVAGLLAQLLERVGEP